MPTKVKETIMRVVFLLTACVSVAAVVLICIFMFANGIPAIAKIGVPEFLLGTTWKPGNDIYGIFPMIIGEPLCHGGRAYRSACRSACCAAVFMARFCPRRLYRVDEARGRTCWRASRRSSTASSALVVHRAVRSRNVFGGSGKSILTACHAAGAL